MSPAMLRDMARPASRARPFDHPHWVFELKHDGFRVLLTRQGQRSSLLSRRGNDLARQFPEIAAAIETLPECVIDGELVMLDEHGRSLFEELRARCRLRTPLTVSRSAAQRPAAVCAFDLLSLDGRDLRTLPLVERKAQLFGMLARGARIFYCQHVVGSGRQLFAAAERLGLEGIMAKLASAPYPRSASSDWVKIKTGRARAKARGRSEWRDP
jgi:ATP-dependent DNA ligase